MMVRSLYEKVAAGTMKGWIQKDLLSLLPSHFFDDPVASAMGLGADCVSESKWRWAGLFNIPGGRRVFLKRDLTKGFMESLKYMIFPSKGRKEWFVAYQSKKRRLNVPNPLGWLERVCRGIVQESYYLSEAVPSKGSLVELIDLLKDEKISHELVRFILRMHNAGLFHQDLHVGNFLWDGDSLYLVDLHRARFLRSLTLKQRLMNLAHLFHSLRDHWGEREYERFFDQYFEGESISKERKRACLRDTYLWMDRLQRRQWKSRTKRCLRESTEFSVKKEGHFIYYHRRDFPLDRLRRALEKHQTIVQKAPLSLVKQSPEVSVSLIEDAGSRICVKHFRYHRWWDRMKTQWRTSKGLRAWTGGHGVSVRGIPSVKLLALVEQKHWTGRVGSFLIMEAPVDEEEMDRFLCKNFGAMNDKKPFIKALACWLAKLHMRKIYHQDMKACNILVSKGAPPWSFKLLDLEDVRCDQTVDEKRLWRTLLQLNTSIPKAIPPKERLRFLKCYLTFNPILRNYKTFLRRLIRKSRERGIVYVSPSGVVKESFS